MPSIQGFKRPVDGTGGLLYHGRDPGDPRYPPLVFKFRTPNPWPYGRPAPFAWRLLPPFGKLAYPVLDLVVDRSTEIVPPARYVWGGRAPRPSLTKPFVRIYRPQIAGSIPQEEGTFDADTILGNIDKQYGWRRAGDIELRPAGQASADLHRFYINHLPVGTQGDLRGKPACIVSNILGMYHVELHLKSVWKPAAYFLQIDDTYKTVKSHEPQIYVFTDSNVSVKNVRHTNKPSRLHVHHVFRGPDRYRRHIPLFHDNEVTSKIGWPATHANLLSEQEIDREVPEGYWWKQFVQGAEDLIGLIPVVGDAYDIGATAYMAATGKAPWTGDRIPRGAAVVYMAAAVGPISVSAVRRLSSTWSQGLPEDLAKLAKDDLRQPLEQLADAETALTMASAANERSTKRLHELVAAAQTGKLTSARFAKEFATLLAATADVSTLQKRFDAMSKYTNLTAVFESTDKLAKPLDELYERYLKRTKHTRTEVTPLEWCRRQTSGVAADELRKALGPNFAAKLRVLAGSGAAAVRPETLRAALTALTETNYLDNYKDLHARTRGLSPVTERDHIFEKRFFLNNPDFSESMDMYENSLAILVPANQAMLVRLRQIDPKLKVWYVHADKRPLMQRLPDGREHEFPLQSLWDVHIDTYRQLGVEVTPNGASFGANVYHELVMNLDYLADDLRQQAAILRKAGQPEAADTLLQKAQYRKRFDPRDRAFRAERFTQVTPGKEWWLRDDS